MSLIHFLFAQAEELGQNLIVPDSIQKAQFAEKVMKLVNTDYRELIHGLLQEAVWILLKIVLALAIWAVGRWLIRLILKFVNGIFERRDVDASLRTFLRNLIRVILMLLLVLTVVQTLGMNITSIIALFASATLAIGMALSGTMQNFAGGVMILLLKPYRVGDYISAQGQAGYVTEIMLFSTKILTTDHQTIYIPNSSIATAIIDNYSTSELRRVEVKAGISYGDSVDDARTAITEICKADSRILSDPAPVVYVSELADSSVNLIARVWVKNADYWDVYFDLNEKIYKTLPKHGANFPFPQLDVHIKNEK